MRQLRRKASRADCPMLKNLALQRARHVRSDSLSKGFFGSIFCLFLPWHGVTCGQVCAAAQARPYPVSCCIASRNCFRESEWEREKCLGLVHGIGHVRF